MMKHYESSVLIHADPKDVFAVVNEHASISSHMNKSSWMMGGGKMETKLDKDKGQKIGSHIKMSGKILGINLFLDEVITHDDPPYHKAWQTVGEINLLVIGHYKMGLDITSQNGNSILKVNIEYELPRPRFTKILGALFGGMYAKWCVDQMIQDVKKNFV